MPVTQGKLALGTWQVGGTCGKDTLLRVVGLGTWGWGLHVSQGKLALGTWQVRLVLGKEPQMDPPSVRVLKQ